MQLVFQLNYAANARWGIIVCQLKVGRNMQVNKLVNGRLRRAVVVVANIRDPECATCRSERSNGAYYRFVFDISSSIYAAPKSKVGLTFSTRELLIQ